jgi:hypothetical protein
MVDLGNGLPNTNCYSSRTVYALTQSIGLVGAVMRPSNPYQVFRDLSVDDDVKSFTYSFSEWTCRVNLPTFTQGTWPRALGRGLCASSTDTSRSKYFGTYLLATTSKDTHICFQSGLAE